MARPKIRHFQRSRYIFIKGQPGPEYPPWSYRAITPEGFFAMAWQHKKIHEEARDRRREAKRLARAEEWSTHPFGVQSGRQFGGRVSKHWGERPRSWSPRRFLPPHWFVVNRGIRPLDCPLCYDRKLFKRWVQCEWGWRREEWESWVPETVSRIKKVREVSSKEVELLRKRLDLAEEIFDKYMYTHREEHKDDYSLLKTFAIPFIYSSAVAARKAKNFPIVTVAQARALWGSCSRSRSDFLLKIINAGEEPSAGKLTHGG